MASSRVIFWKSAWPMPCEERRNKGEGCHVREHAKYPEVQQQHAWLKTLSSRKSVNRSYRMVTTIKPIIISDSSVLS
eukprot:1373095-Prymnesium_polylepis.1